MDDDMKYVISCSIKAGFFTPVNNKSLFTSKNTLRITVTKFNLLIMFRLRIDVYSENQINPTDCWTTCRVTEC
jgi:hypothetical protein